MFRPLDTAAWDTVADALAGAAAAVYFLGFLAVILAALDKLSY
jgi:hypothetical protein